MYKAIGAPGSRLTRVLWMLEELGQPYELVKAKQHTEALLAYNPGGKGPALVDGDFALTDSAAICGYLAEKHADAGMGPEPTPQGRALFNAWLIYVQAEFEAPLWNKLRHRMMLPEDCRADVGAATAHDFAAEVKSLDKKLEGKEFALGDRFTAVDVVLGHCGQWARGAKFEIGSPIVNAYFDRVLARPAIARAKQREKEAA